MDELNGFINLMIFVYILYQLDRKYIHIVRQYQQYQTH